MKSHCCSNTKLYVFKSEVEKFVFCQPCVTAAVNYYGFETIFKQKDAKNISNLKYHCCSREINGSCSFVLLNISDLVEQSSPFICKNCRSFKVGQFNVCNEHSIKLSDYRHHKLCEFMLPSGNLCLTTAISNMVDHINPRCSRHDAFKAMSKTLGSSDDNDNNADLKNLNCSRSPQSLMLAEMQPKQKNQVFIHMKTLLNYFTIFIYNRKKRSEKVWSVDTK
jgi:hypothetical protein